MAGMVYIVCGGTGGHLAPGIATAQRLRQRQVPVRLVTSEKEVDSLLLGAYPDIPYMTAKGAPFSLRPLGLLGFLWKNLYGFVQAIRTLRQDRPPVLVAFGGFQSVSFVIAAWLLRIPVVLHEANRVAGRSVRTLAVMADLVFLPDGVALPGIETRRLQRLSMPLRQEVQHIPKDQIRKKMEIPVHAKVLVVSGGSQGAEILNTWVETHHKSLAADGIWVILVAGPGKNHLPERTVLESEQGASVEVRSFAFHPAMYELFSCADMVVSRAGAGTIAELVTCLAPSILVPYPHAADDHQTANARDLERRGGSILIGQPEIPNLYREILDLIYNDWLLGRMRSNLRQLSSGDAAARLADHLIKSYVKALVPVGAPEPVAQAESTPPDRHD